MSQVLQKCDACGKVETPLTDGRCQTCVRQGRRALPTEVRIESIDRETTQLVKRDRALPSTFIWVGLMLEVLGLVPVVIGQLARTPGGAMLMLVGLIPIVVGSIFVSVGTIRWAIWPLIEKAYERE
jgi:hypothetical protein